MFGMYLMVISMLIGVGMVFVDAPETVGGDTPNPPQPAVPPRQPGPPRQKPRVVVRDV